MHLSKYFLKNKNPFLSYYILQIYFRQKLKGAALVHLICSHSSSPTLIGKASPYGQATRGIPVRNRPFSVQTPLESRLEPRLLASNAVSTLNRNLCRTREPRVWDGFSASRPPFGAAPLRLSRGPHRGPTDAGRGLGGAGACRQARLREARASVLYTCVP